MQASSSQVIRPFPALQPGDVVLDESGRQREVISFGPENMACSQTHLSSPGSRIVFARWVDSVNWRNPEAGSPVWEHTLRAA